MARCFGDDNLHLSEHDVRVLAKGIDHIFQVKNSMEKFEKFLENEGNDENIPCLHFFNNCHSFLNRFDKIDWDTNPRKSKREIQDEARHLLHYAEKEVNFDCGQLKRLKDHVETGKPTDIREGVLLAKKDAAEVLEEDYNNFIQSLI